MGLETLAIVGLTLFQADAGLRAAEKQAKFDQQQADRVLRQAEADQKALQEQTDLEQEERRKRTRALVGSQKVSFLQAGLTLEGTPEFALEQTFTTGQEDMELAQRNTDTRIRNIQNAANTQADSFINRAEQTLSNARTEAIGSLVSAGSSIAAPTFGDSFGGQFDIGGELKGINVPGTGTRPSMSPGGTIIPGRKPTRINF